MPNLPTALAFPLGGFADFFAPVIGAFSPPVGNPLGFEQPISFSVSDETELGSIVIAVDYGFYSEIVYNGTAFAPPFDSGSTRTDTVLAGKLRAVDFVLAREEGGWLGTVTLTIVVHDKFGHQADPFVFSWPTPTPVRLIPDTGPRGHRRPSALELIAQSFDHARGGL